jgi:hypothetical protein
VLAICRLALDAAILNLNSFLWMFAFLHNIHRPVPYLLILCFN